MLEAIHTLTSSSKENLVALLSKPRAPEDIADALKMTRQAVDRHLKDMMVYGIVEKIWVTGGRRPRVEFKLSPLGHYFFDSMNEFMSSFKERGREDLDTRLKSLDLLIIKGEVDQKRYSELKKELESNLEWFREASVEK